MIDPVGKEFIYISKYGGRLRLRCASVSHHEKLLFDPETEAIIKWLANKKKGSGDPGEQPPKPTNTYIASQVDRFYITAEGNAYEESDCYIIHEDE